MLKFSFTESAGDCINFHVKQQVLCPPSNYYETTCLHHASFKTTMCFSASGEGKVHLFTVLDAEEENLPSKQNVH